MRCRFQNVLSFSGASQVVCLECGLERGQVAASNVVPEECRAAAKDQATRVHGHSWDRRRRGGMARGLGG